MKNAAKKVLFALMIAVSYEDLHEPSEPIEVAHVHVYVDFSANDQIQ